MLEHIITSKAKRSLLKLFLTNPESSIYTREIARRTGEPLNAVRRELGHLEKAGLIASRREGNLKLYSLIKESPLYTELKRIVYATIGIGDYLTDRLADSGQIELAFIYGSVARDDETAMSDIDLFVVGNIDEEELHNTVSQIENDIGRSVNYTIMTGEEFAERIRSAEPFVKRVMSEKKIILKGNPNVH